ncbi:Os02g0541200 [Oryza sativa Japonica Group]|uniref:Os02g0541200 protein n=1 Tax=Oryza sativa subsp. japonica TaxID=39947 RepID=C7IYR2_ORYSJ|nr:Os02g0541200 [Oryza sativa Japonica Group]|eukprot:NP_001173014.1 Os02g0541200 [Oryza sativa Japonica Group]
MSCGGLRLRVSPVARFTFPVLVGSAATEGLCVGRQWMNSGCSTVESLGVCCRCGRLSDNAAVFANPPDRLHPLRLGVPNCNVQRPFLLWGFLPSKGVKLASNLLKPD